MVILLMPHRQPLLHELLAALGVDADAHWIAGRHSVVAEDLTELVKQSDGRMQKIFGWKCRVYRSLFRRFVELEA